MNDHDAIRAIGDLRTIEAAARIQARNLNDAPFSPGHEPAHQKRIAEWCEAAERAEAAADAIERAIGIIRPAPGRRPKGETA